MRRKIKSSSIILKTLLIYLIINALLMPFDKVFAKSFFIENKGQFPNNILFYLINNDFSIFITKTQIYCENKKENIKKIFTIENKYNNFKIEYNNYPYFNFLIGNNPKNWIKKVRTCNNIHFLKDNQEIFQIKLDDELSLSANSTFTIPIKEYDKSYDLILNSGDKIILRGKINDNTFSIDNNKKDKIQEINPKFYSSYLGGSGWNVGEELTVDKNKNIYIVGTTDSRDFPVTDSVFQDKLRLTKKIYSDCFIAKFDSSGQNLIFATYLGSQLEDFGKSIAIDQNSNIYITGYLGPTGTFPFTSNAYDTTENGAYDSFIAKINSDGSELLASTYLGGSNDDFSMRIILDKQGHINVCGYTKESDDFPITEKALQKYHNGKNDAFYCKLSNDLDSLLYSTLIGGLDDDFAEAMTVDRNNYIYIAGSTRSLNFPVTSDAYDDLYNDTLTNSRRNDGFISIISSNGSLDYSTFFGGSNSDIIYDIEVDNSLAFYVTGITESKNFPVSAFAYDTTYRSKEGERSAGDIFVSKFLPTRKFLEFSTYIGGSSVDKAYDIEIAQDSYIYFVGASSSADLNISKNAFQKTFKDSSFGSDAILGIIEPPGDKLIYLSYLGGTESDICYSMQLIDNEFFYITGTTSSSNFPLSQSAYSSTFHNDTTSEVFYSILQPKILAVSAGGDKDGIIEACRGDIITLGSADNIGIRGSATFNWYPTTGLNNSNIAQPTLQVNEEANYILQVIDSKGWEDWDTVYIKLLPIIDAKIFGPEYVFENSVHSYGTRKNDFAKFKWLCQGGTILTSDTLFTINVKWGKDSIGYLKLITENDLGCKDTSDNYFVHIGEIFKPKITILTDSVLCTGEQAILDAGYGYKSYNWSDGKTTRYDTISTTGYYWVYVKDSSNFQALSDTVFIEFLPSPQKPKIYFNYDSTLLSVDVFNMKYQWYHNGQPIDGANSRTYVPEKIGWYKCRIGWDINECTTFSDSLELRFSNVNLFNNYDDHFIIYPNPSENFIRLLNLKRTEVIISNFRIINIFGEELFYAENWEIINTINISNLPSGLYFLTFYYLNNLYRYNLVVIK